MTLYYWCIFNMYTYICAPVLSYVYVIKQSNVFSCWIVTILVFKQYIYEINTDLSFKK